MTLFISHLISGNLFLTSYHTVHKVNEKLITGVGTYDVTSRTIAHVKSRLIRLFIYKIKVRFYMYLLIHGFLLKSYFT